MSQLITLLHDAAAWLEWKRLPFGTKWLGCVAGGWVSWYYHRPSSLVKHIAREFWARHPWFYGKQLLRESRVA